MNRYVLNETSYFGAGCRTELATEVKTKGYKKALLVSDRVLASCGVLDKVKKVLNNAGIAYDEFLEIKQNPTIKNCQDGLEAFKKSGADFIIYSSYKFILKLQFLFFFLLYFFKILIHFVFNPW